MGLIEVTGSIQVKETFEGETLDISFYAKARRFRPTTDLIKLAASYGIVPETIKRNFRREYGKTPPVTVRDERYDTAGKRLRPRRIPNSTLKRFPSYQEEQARIGTLNDILLSSGFDLEETPRQCQSKFLEQGGAVA